MAAFLSATAASLPSAASPSTVCGPVRRRRHRWPSTEMVQKADRAPQLQEHRQSLHLRFDQPPNLAESAQERFESNSITDRFQLHILVNQQACDCTRYYSNSFELLLRAVRRLILAPSGFGTFPFSNGSFVSAIH